MYYIHSRNHSVAGAQAQTHSQRCHQWRRPPPPASQAQPVVRTSAPPHTHCRIITFTSEPVPSVLAAALSGAGHGGGHIHVQQLPIRRCAQIGSRPKHTTAIAAEAAAEAAAAGAAADTAAEAATHTAAEAATVAVVAMADAVGMGVA